MSLAEYSGFLAVTIGAIVLVMRACFFLFVVGKDPIKAVLPDVARWAMLFESKKKARNAIDINS